MPKKPLSWIISILGTGFTAWGTIYLFNLQETMGEAAAWGGMALFIVGMVVTWRFAKWYDNKNKVVGRKRR